MFVLVLVLVALALTYRFPELRDAARRCRGLPEVPQDEAAARASGRQPKRNRIRSATCCLRARSVARLASQAAQESFRSVRSSPPICFVIVE